MGQGSASIALGQRSTARAPVIGNRRSSLSPRLLIRPSRALPPLEPRRGTNHQPGCELARLRKAAGSVTVATRVLAVIGPRDRIIAVHNDGRQPPRAIA